MGLNKNFIDRVEIKARSGDGGPGSVHFRHEKYVEKGGPDGGDGGKGGDVIIKVNKQLFTLRNLRYKRHFIAENGEKGSGSRCHGKDGSDVFIEVPNGTIVFDSVTGSKILDVVDFDEFVILKGGMGGLGNYHFRRPTDQTPRYAQPGQKGEEKNLRLELSLLADVGIIGFPNVGKSTLLSVLTNARPQIGNYDFTTLSPQLGILTCKGRECVVADLPGIIEGASLGKGLGLQFLQHIKRIKVLLFALDVSSDVFKCFCTLNDELRKYSVDLTFKKKIVCITKCDIVEDSYIGQISKKVEDLNPIFISSVTGFGLDKLVSSIFSSLF